MTEPIPVEELQKRDDSNLPLTPGTNEEEALAFLAANAEFGWPPRLVAERTDVPDTSVNKTLTRLRDKGLVKRSSGRYFVAPDRVDEIRGLLGDLYNLKTLAEEPGQTPTHPVGGVDDDRPDRDGERADDAEIETLIQD